MTSTELAQHHGADLAADMDYARTISTGAMLPSQYRGKPADILIAMGLGRAMGLSPAESLYRIHVIQGRPTASAELIAANVRKAGHILRVKGDETTARAVIIRSDDPEFEFESVWNLDRAKRLGLSDKDGWKKQPGTMMRWRAITEVARLACPEALYGVAYVREELDDEPRQEFAPRVTAADFAPGPKRYDRCDDTCTTDCGHCKGAGAPVDAEVVGESGASEEWPNTLTDATRKHMFALFDKAGVKDNREGQLENIRRIIGRDVQSRSELTEDEARAVCIDLETYLAAQQA